VDGTEMEVIEVRENVPEEARCVGTIAMVTRDNVSAQTAISWLMDDRAYMGPGEYNMRYIVQGNVLVHQRNECIAKMDGDWILFIDSDMTFQPGAITNLVQTRERFDLDIIGGLCFQRTPPYQPTMYVMASNAEHGYTFLEDWDDDSAVEVDATGMAFVLIHKRVFDRILRKQTGEGFPDLEARRNMRPPPFFRWEGEYGEDFMFCREAKEAGNRIFVDTSIKIGHVGPKTITQEDFFREIAFRKPDEQEFRTAQLASVGHKTITPQDARKRLGVTW
jgi:glycosyltransferase involved in cell wall biosynthesis